GPTLWHALHADPHHPQREAWFLGLGATLGRIHATPVPAALEDQSATPWLDDQRRRRAAAAPEAPAQWLERRRATASRVIDVCCFVHGDFTIDNAIVGDDGIAGIIDWGAAGRGDP